MKRFSSIRLLIKALNGDDLAIFIGKGICKEAFVYDRLGNIYLDSYDNMFSVALGMAMHTEKRIFVFCDDEYFLRNLSELSHIAISGCGNVYLLMLVSGYYLDVGNFPTIYDSLNSVQGVLFNMGFFVHNYTRHFQNMRDPSRELNSIWEKTRSASVGIIKVDKGLKKIDKIPNFSKSVNDLTEFLNKGEEQQNGL